MKRTLLRSFSLLFAGAALFCAAALPAAALDLSPSGSAIVRAAPPLTVEAQSSDAAYRFDLAAKTLTVEAGDLTLRNTAAEGTLDFSILVAGGYTGTLTLDGVRLAPAGGAALTLQEDARVTLQLTDSNTLQGADGYPGILVEEPAALTLDGTGSLTAAGGAGGAGIGGAAAGPEGPTAAGQVTLLGGTLTARGGTGADDIGAGQGGTGGTFATGTEGRAILYADTISDLSQQDQWACLLIQSGQATVRGTVTLTQDLTLPAGQPLTIPGEAGLTVAGCRLEVKTLNNQGTLTLGAAASGQSSSLTVGTLTGSGALTLGTGSTVQGDTLTLDGPLTLEPKASLKAKKLTTGGTTAVAADASLTAGALENTGTLTNQGTLALGTGESANRGILENAGILTLTGSDDTDATLTLAAGSTLQNRGTLTARDAYLLSNGTLENEGLLELDDALLSWGEPDTAPQGSGTWLLAHTGGLASDPPQGLTLEYRLFLDASQGTVDTASLVTQGHKLTQLPTPTRRGYTFDGWFTAAQGGYKVSTDTLFTGSTTLYAHWTAVPLSTATPKPVVQATPAPTPAPTATPRPTPLEMHTLHFNTMGGLPLEDVRFGLGAPVELWPYTPVRPGYLFAGWYSDEALTKPVGTIVLVRDTTLYAKWTVDPAAAAAAAQSSSGGSTGGKGGGTAKATATPAPTATPQPTPTVTPAPTPVATPEATPAPEETPSDDGLPILPLVGGILLLAAAVAAVVVLRRRMGDEDGHYHRRR